MDWWLKCATDAGDDDFVVSVRYCGREVLHRTVSSRAGCRLIYDEANIIERLDNQPLNEFGQMVRTEQCSFSVGDLSIFRRIEVTLLLLLLLRRCRMGFVCVKGAYYLFIYFAVSST